MTFIEVVRRERLAVAVFYDGVNEFSRHLEFVQSADPSPWYETMGYPYERAARKAREIPWPRIDLGFVTLPTCYRSRLLTRLNDALARRPAAPPARDIRDPAQVAAMAREVADLYAENVKTIRAVAEAYGVTPLFLLQPHLHSVRGKRLTAYEESLRDGPERLLAEESYRLIRDHPFLKTVRFHDLSDALDGLDGKNHFTDFCHVTPDANRAVAERIAPILRDLLPAGCFPR